MLHPAFKVISLITYVIVSTNAFCPCPYTYTPVCGKDGNTYDNTCLMRCEKVQLKHRGECRSSSFRSLARSRFRGRSSQSGCFCTLEYDPVCGADGTTYSNDCALDCAGVDMVYEGSCIMPLPMTRLMCGPCSYLLMPVCGDDNRTYSNLCLLRCAGARLRYLGKCRPMYV